MSREPNAHLTHSAFRYSQCLCLLRGITDTDFSHSEGFIITHHGPELHCVNRVRNIEKMVSCITYASIISLYFSADEILVWWLDRAIKNGCAGEGGPSWKDNLPESAVPNFPSNSQTRMVAGSTDILNILNVALRHHIVTDGQLTSVQDRPQASRFKEFAQATYPSIHEEASAKVYPVMLNVTDGLCLELPFGASFYNRENVYIGMNALQGLLNFNIPGADIGIVAFYPSQAEAYRRALKQYHHHAPAIGYDAVKVDIIENWIGKEIGIAIVDLVRTANASGNLGHLSQARRVKLALTIHRNGLILVGDRKCTTNSLGKVTTKKLEKVLEWLQIQGRIVDSNHESVSEHVGQFQNRGRSMDSNPESVSKHINHSEQKIIETLKALDGNVRAPPRDSNQSQDIAAIRASFARQVFLNTKQNATSDSVAGASPERADGKAAVTDEPRILAQHSVSSAGMRDNAVALGGSMAKQAPKDSESGSSDKSQSNTSTGSSARSFGGSKATEDAFSRFQARLQGQGTSLLDPMTNLTENPRKKVTMVDDQVSASPYARPTHLGAKPASVSPSIVSPSTSNRVLARNPFANSPAVTAQVSIRNLNTEEPRQQAQARVQENPVSIEPSGGNDFNTQYRKKYKDIRAILNSLRGSTEVSPGENQLFRRLGEAYIMEDSDEFDSVYAELLRLAGMLANGFAVSV